MRIPRFRTLNEGGFHAHVILPVLAVLAVAGIGAYLVGIDHAATAPYSGPCTGTTYSTATTNTSATSKACIQQAQDLLDGVQHQNYSSYRTASSLVSGSTFKYGSEYYLTMNGTYSSTMASAVDHLPLLSGGSATSSLTSGTSDSSGWQILCQDAAGAGLNGSAGNGALNFSGSTKVAGEYTNATLSSIFTATCGKPTTSTTTTTTTPPKTTTTASAACDTKTFQQGSVDSGSSHCVQYIQQIIDGRDAYIFTKLYSPTTINSESISTVTNGSQYYSVNSKFGVTGGSYTSGMKGGVTNLQKWDNAPNASDIKLYFNLTTAQFSSDFKPSGSLPTTGVTESKTWYDLCQWISRTPTASRTVTDSTDYTGGKPNSAGTNKTNMWYLRSYMRTGYAAASDAGCKM